MITGGHQVSALAEEVKGKKPQEKLLAHSTL